MNESERNSITGLPLSKSDDTTELNSFTGVSQDVKDDDDVAKGNGKKWPSISERSENDSGPDPEPEPVSKSTDGNPWPSLTGELVGNTSESGEFELHVPIFYEKAADEQIVYGIVYEPDTKDAQGDQASAEEIRKAAYSFMENAQQFKVMHKGKAVNVKVLESYIATQDLTIAKRKVKKGSWVLVTHVLDKKLWQDIKDGTYTGYSMAGHARID